MPIKSLKEKPILVGILYVLVLIAKRVFGLYYCSGVHHRSLHLCCVQRGQHWPAASSDRHLLYISVSFFHFLVAAVEKLLSYRSDCICALYSSLFTNEW